MRVGVKLGPLYASTSTRRRRRGGGSGSFIGLIIGLMIVAFIIFWPLVLGQRRGSGYYAWTWAIAVPWWLLLLVAAIGYAASKGTKVKPSQGKGAATKTGVTVATSAGEPEQAE